MLHETAYAVRAARIALRQARENVKKLRGMIRRGAEWRLRELAVIADHLERLAVGDESNAAIDAIDAVSPTTVHAAKASRFPIVFVVNMGRGTGGDSVPADPGHRATPAGKPSVAIADYQSEADEEASGAKSARRSKRLLRRRSHRCAHRLYLSATVEAIPCLPDGEGEASARRCWRDRARSSN